MKRVTMERTCVAFLAITVITLLSEAFPDTSIRVKCSSISRISNHCTRNLSRSYHDLTHQEDNTTGVAEKHTAGSVCTARGEAVDIALSYKPTSFRPAPFARNAHVQTISGAILRGLRFHPQGPHLDFSYWPPLQASKHMDQVDPPSSWWDRRVRLDTPDGDFFDVDYKYCRNLQDKCRECGIVVIAHGLESSSNSPQIIDAALAFLAIDMDVVCVNSRGCSGEPNRTPGAYHLGFTEDLRFFLSQLPPQKRDIYLVGFSLGANVVLKLLGELQETALSQHRIRGAAVSAAPFDIVKSAPKLTGTTFNRFIYDSNFLRTLKKKATVQHDLLGEDRVPYKVEQIEACQTVADFENAFIAPVYGFADNVDYYEKASSISYIDSIHVPTLVINSLDDPFFDTSCYPSESKSRPLKLHYTSHGGHLGYMLHQVELLENNAAPSVSSWMPSELARFFNHVRYAIQKR